MGHGGDVIEELTADHRAVTDLFEQIVGTPPGLDERKRLADRLTIELVRHTVAEEQYLYPAVRDHLADGDALADEEIAEHARVEALLKSLEAVDADNPDFNHLIVKLRTEVTAHIKDEEERVYGRLRTACSPDELAELGGKVRTAKKAAPTRPHPAAPTTPPADKLLAPGLGLVDRARDLITGRGK